MAEFRLYFETMAGTHLTDAVRALRDAGSSDSLYEAVGRGVDPRTIDYDTYGLARDTAEYERVSYSRRALLFAAFAAFAAEAYANDFLYDTWGGQDRDALEKLSTVDRYVLLPQLARRAVALSRDTEPVQTVKLLVQRRDELVHAKPRGSDLTYHPTNHNPGAAAKCIVAAAEAASELFGGAPAGSVLSYALGERQRLLDFGAAASKDLPGWDDPPIDLDLLRNARPQFGE